MLLAVPPAMEATSRLILARHQVRTTVIGRFTDNGRYCVFHQPRLDERSVIELAPGAVPTDLGELGFDVPYAMLELPISERNVGPPPAAAPASRLWPALDIAEVSKVLEQVVADADVASQWYADAQYDSTVQGNTSYGPHYGSRSPVTAGYWAGTPVDGSSAAAVVSTAFNPWLFSVHPVRALRQLLCGLLAGQVLAGVALRDICLCDNFYTPHLTEHWREWLVAMVDELCLLVRHFGTPVISGKDSSAGSTATEEGLVSVPAAVFLTALGKVPHEAQLLGEEWTAAGSLLVRLGPATPTPTGTVAARALNLAETQLDELALNEASRYLSALAASRRLFRSGTRLGAGGIAAQVTVGSLASGLGVDLDRSMYERPGGRAEALFAEHRCGVLVEIGADDLANLPADLEPTVVGRLVAEPRVRLGDTDLLTPSVQQRWTNSFAERLR